MIWLILIIYCVGAWYLLNPLFKHFYNKNDPNVEGCPDWILEDHIKQCKKRAITFALLWPIALIFGIVSNTCSGIYNLLENHIK